MSTATRSILAGLAWAIVASALGADFLAVVVLALALVLVLVVLVVPIVFSVSSVALAWSFDKDTFLLVVDLVVVMI